MDMETKCFICGFVKETIDKNAPSIEEGFDYHIENGIYMFYLI